MLDLQRAGSRKRSSDLWYYVVLHTWQANQGNRSSANVTTAVMNYTYSRLGRQEFVGVTKEKLALQKQFAFAHIEETKLLLVLALTGAWTARPRWDHVLHPHCHIHFTVFVNQVLQEGEGEASA